jgi:hypothetical protein
MSKKVLNYAGKRPMLLALTIMATLSIGLLFSGWLTPMAGRAQPSQNNPPPNNENTNCPNYTTNVAPNCPSIINYGTLTPMSFCVKLGDPLPDPAYTAGTATAGNVITTITETCANTATASTNPVNYSFYWYYNPPKPTGKVAPGTYSRQAIEYCASSDTNDCPSPGAHTMGTVNWTVVDTNESPEFSWSLNSSAVADVINNLTESICVQNTCNPSYPPSGSINVAASFHYECCNGQKTKVVKITGGGTINFGACDCSLPVYGIPFILTVNADLSWSGSLSDTISGEIGCDGANVCTTATVAFNVSGGASIVVISPKIMKWGVSLDASAGGDGKFCFNKDGYVPGGGVELCLYSTKLVGYYQWLSGRKHAISHEFISTQLCTPRIPS